MEIRDVTYMQALQVIQSEEYLSADDLDILRYHIVQIKRSKFVQIYQMNKKISDLIAETRFMTA